MLLFYTPGIKGEVFHLPREESKHVIRVLRLKAGDAIHLTDGKGNLFSGIIKEEDPGACTISITGKVTEYGKRNFRLHVAIAPTKNINRFEWFLEKATEIGIEEITPMLCDHSERKNLRIDRLERVLVSAMKQSLKAYLPKLNEMTTFSEVVREGKEQKKFLAHLDDQLPVHIKEKYSRNEDVIILIGPEGDFSIDELVAAEQAGYQTVSLGASRLRTETAGLAACSAIALLND